MLTNQIETEMKSNRSNDMKIDSTEAKNHDQHVLMTNLNINTNKNKNNIDHDNQINIENDSVTMTMIMN